MFNIIDEEADAEKCKIMESIIYAGSKMIRTTQDDSSLRDVVLIFSSQLTEQYEIASYGNIIQLANVPGYNHAANIFSQTLEEEKRADELLTEIAEEYVNYNASKEIQSIVYYKLTVEDNGIGFIQDDSERMFKMFERLNDKEYKGSGKGLAIARKIMEVHNGEVRYLSVIFPQMKINFFKR